MNTTGLTPHMILVLLKRDFHWLYYFVLYDLFLLLIWHSAPLAIVHIMIGALIIGIADRFSTRSRYSYPFLYPNYLKAEYITFLLEFGLILLAVALRFLALDPPYTMPTIAILLIIAAIALHSSTLKVRLPQVPVVLLIAAIALFLITVACIVIFSGLSLAELLAGVFFLPLIFIWDSTIKFWLLLAESYPLQVIVLLCAAAFYSISQFVLLKSFKVRADYKPEKHLGMLNGHFLLQDQPKYAIDTPRGRLLETQVVAKIQHWLFRLALRHAHKNTKTRIKRWLNYMLFSRVNAQFLLIDFVSLTVIILSCAIIAKAEPSAPAVGISVISLLSYSYFRNLLLSGQLLALREQLALLNLMNTEMDRRACFKTVGYLFVTNLFIPAVVFYGLVLVLAKSGMESGERFYPFISAILVVNLFSAATGLLLARIARPSSLLQRSLYIVLHFVLTIAYLFMVMIFDIPQFPMIVIGILLVVSLNRWWATGTYQYQ